MIENHFTKKIFILYKLYEIKIFKSYLKKFIYLKFKVHQIINFRFRKKNRVMHIHFWTKNYFDPMDLVRAEFILVLNIRSQG